MTATERRHSVLIVEDDPSTRRRLAEIVASLPEIESVVAVGNCAEARERFRRDPPDVLLVDLGLPDGSGVDLIRELKAKSQDAEIAVITVFGDEQSAIRSIEAGASGYLLKGGDSDYVADSIRELLAGGSPVSPAIARHLLRRLRASSTPPPAPAPVPEADTALSEREIEVLKLTAKGFTFPEIADLLGISVHTVTTYMRRIYRKLSVSSKGEAVYEAVNLGVLSLDG